MALKGFGIASLVGQARRYASQHPDQVSSGIDRLGDVVDRRTGGKHASHIAKAKGAASKALGTSGRRPGDVTDGPDDAGRPRR